MLADYLTRIKAWAGEYRGDIAVGLLVFFISMASFGLGRLSVLLDNNSPIQISNPLDSSKDAPIMVAPGDSQVSSGALPDGRLSGATSVNGSYVASKNGSAYHLTTCPGAKQIKESNKVYFYTKEEAESAGYRPAGNCPGLNQ